MRSLEALNDPEPFSELQKDFPRGGCFQHLNGAIIRQVVVVLQGRLQDLNVPLRLSIEPKSDRKTKSGELRLPVSLTVIDEDLRFSIPIVTFETSVMIADRYIKTAKDDAVVSVAAALIGAIQNALRAKTEMN